MHKCLHQRIGCKVIIHTNDWVCTEVHTKSNGIHQFAPQKRQITGVQGIAHQVIWCTSVAHTKNCSSHTSGTPESEVSVIFGVHGVFFGVKSVQPYFFYSRRKAFIFKKKNTTHQHSDIKTRIKRNITSKSSTQ